MKRFHATLMASVAMMVGSYQQLIPTRKQKVAETPANTIRWKSGRASDRNHYHEETRFTRKMQRYGGEYKPGKLFKGHRI